MDLKVKSVTSKFNVKGQNIYGKITWKDNRYDLFHIKLLDGRNTWSGRFSKEFAKNCRSLLGEAEEEYKTNVKLGLLGPQDKFAYDFVVFPEDSDTALFTWKKVCEDGTVLTHGSMPVHLDDVNESKDTLIDFLINENKELTEVRKSKIIRYGVLTKMLHKCESVRDMFVDRLALLNLKCSNVQLPKVRKTAAKLVNGYVQVYQYDHYGQ